MWPLRGEPLAITRLDRRDPHGDQLSRPTVEGQESAKTQSHMLFSFSAKPFLNSPLNVTFLLLVTANMGGSEGGGGGVAMTQKEGI